MTGYKRVNYYELCRLCTSSQQKDKIHIFREEGKKMQLQQKIQSCFPLLVCEHDYLPKVVCTSCVQILDQCFSFRQSCINSEAMLSSYFSNFRFTDDFKKNGKVYVKDTGQKPGQHQVEVEKKIHIPEPPQHIPQTFELPIPQKPVVKLLPTNHKTSQPLINTMVTTNVPVISKDHTQRLQQNLLTTCNLTAFNMGAGLNNNNVKSLEQISNEIGNVLKTNQTMMLIDVEQLMESGNENEVSKLREALLKPEVKKAEKTKIFKCDICEKTFKRREHLYQHSKLHSGIRPFSCVHCPKTFSRKEHLMRHLTSHSGAKDFSCDICNKRFSRPDNLKKHKKTHQKSPFRCEICTKNFIMKHYYVAHMQAHQNGENVTKLEISDV